MRIVLDTNVLVSALTTHGACSNLLSDCIERHSIIVTRFILDELERVLVAKFGFAPNRAKAAARFVTRASIVVSPEVPDAGVSRDPDDDNILAAAVAGNCRCIVTGDKDLLSLVEYCGIAILSPGNFYHYLTSTTTSHEQAPQ